MNFWDLSKAHDHVVIKLSAPDKLCLMHSSLRAVTAQKMKFSIKNFFSKCDQIRSFLRIWSHSLEKT